MERPLLDDEVECWNLAIRPSGELTSASLGDSALQLMTLSCLNVQFDRLALAKTKSCEHPSEF